MIICHQYKFIFFKTRKTAGTSIEIALSKFCGPRDIITAIAPEDEKIRRSLGYRTSQNYWMPVTRYTRSDWRKLIVNRIPRRFRNHSRAASIRQHIDPRIWETYTKISIERNPWDKALSFYYWYNRSLDEKPSLMDFITIRKIRHQTLSNWPIYSIGDQVAADYVLRFESLSTEIEHMQELLKLPEKLELPHAKSGVRPDRRHYSEVVGPQERDQIAGICAREIAHFGYTFEAKH